jgi:hypothetical protein
MPERALRPRCKKCKRSRGTYTGPNADDGYCRTCRGTVRALAANPDYFKAFKPARPEDGR